MRRRIRILIGAEQMEGELNESRTAQAIWAALPLAGEGRPWGKEIYFSIPIEIEAENPQEVVPAGALAYWPAGRAFCIFWGATPASRGEECRPYSPVNVFGRLLGDLAVLDRLVDLRVQVEKLE